MTSLDHFLDVASEEIEADLARWHPALDLGELHRHGGLTHRRLWLLLRFLPMESAWKTWVRDNLEHKEPDPNAAPDFTGQQWTLLNFQIQGLRNDLYALMADRKEGEQFEPPYRVPASKTRAADIAVPAQTGSVVSIEERRRRLELVRRNRGWSQN